MNKTAKGALAAGAAAVLLMGGAGTLAFWTDTATVEGTDIASGHLKLDASSCTTASWLLDDDSVYDGSQLLIPGDTLTKNCNVVVDIAGEHLDQIDLDVTVPTDVTGDQDLIDELSATATVGGGTADNVAVTDGQPLAVAITVTWPYGIEDNDSNVAAGLTAALGDITVVATQDHLNDAN
ncbi:alternate-type signal peptide domain-containing protein [Nocardioides daeguensis]|uniref:Alternate-type signal peptide domain-containing protein n=1 Tax=Nocardioides daeguensis TaxID=908359 RepID=A0ABP6VWM7_9ACTN|nr:alternate-type signal peptide domain-containing protein [Nocardioides daeguensis]MBV6726866.1 alternate-type signal peptide domain-containing protein [Nocardioides daeguensis]MCR1774382.1 alternate-type signal peptide domain-containing protein [Nocardioides daeguensis]